MFPSGPIVLVSDQANAELAGFLRARGNVLVNESSWETAPAAIKAGRPAALILDEQRFDPDILEPLTGAIAAVHEPYMPVLARASPVGAPFVLRCIADRGECCAGTRARAIVVGAALARAARRRSAIRRGLRREAELHVAAQPDRAVGERNGPGCWARTQLSRPDHGGERAGLGHQHVEHGERGALPVHPRHRRRIDRRRICTARVAGLCHRTVTGPALPRSADRIDRRRAAVRRMGCAPQFRTSRQRPCGRSHRLHAAARAHACQCGAARARARIHRSPRACSIRSLACSRRARSCASSSARWTRRAHSRSALSLARFSFETRPAHGTGR